MPSNLNIYTGVLISSGVMSSMLAWNLFFRFKEVGKYASILLFLAGWWSITSAGCLMEDSFTGLFLAVKLQYISISFFPAVWILFIQAFLQRDHLLTLFEKLLLFLIPFATLIMVWTSQNHSLYYEDPVIELGKDFSFFKFTPGFAYYVHVFYFYVCLGTGIVLLLRHTGIKNSIFAAQAKLIVLGTVIPAACNFIYLLGFKPANGIDLTSCAFTITTLTSAYSLYKYRLFDLLPIAREKIIDSLLEAVIVLDEKNRIVFANPAARRSFSPSASIEGIHITEVFPELKDACGKPGEVEIRRETDRERIFAVSTAAFSTARSNRGCVLLFKDITERKLAEQEALRTREEAIKTSKAKADFLSTMSHEIRTPMNAVIGFTSLLLQHAREDQKEYLNLLKYSGENLLVLINDILDYSKIDAGKIELEYTDFNLAELVKKVLQTLSPLASERKVALKSIIDATLPNYLQGDPVRLGQILTNLTGNAVKFTEDGEVSIQVKVMSTNERETRILIKVNDTGIGIPADKQKTIFESFTQASADTTRKFGGTGLGLAITKKLVELHNGEIEVESVPGEGSSFSFEVSLPNSSRQLETQDKNTTKALGSLSGMRVLLAEDNKINVLLARQFLKQWDIECEVADNGHIALEMVQKNNYDLILMDLHMPVMDGYEAAQAIRRLPCQKLNKLPIIALSAAALTEEKDMVYSAGMNGFVTKPFKPEELFEAISYHSETQLG